MTALQLYVEKLAVPTFMCAEAIECIDQMRCGQAGHQDLAGVDADGTMLAGMIDLQDAVAEGCARDSHRRARNVADGALCAAVFLHGGVADRSEAPRSRAVGATARWSPKTDNASTAHGSHTHRLSLIHI